MEENQPQRAPKPPLGPITGVKDNEPEPEHGPQTTSPNHGRPQGQNTSFEPLGFSPLLSDVLFTLNHSSDAGEEAEREDVQPKAQGLLGGASSCYCRLPWEADGRNKGERSAATKTAAKLPLCQLDRGKGCRVLPAVSNQGAGVVGWGTTSQSHCNQVQAAAPRKTEASR